MAMTERSRNALYEGLTGFIDEEAVGEMLSYFPARDVEEPASKELVRAECSDVRAELSQLRAGMEQRFGEVERRFGDLRSELVAEIRAATRWTIGAMVSLTGVVVAATAALG
jgi:hypothetical protein